MYVMVFGKGVLERVFFNDFVISQHHKNRVFKKVVFLLYYTYTKIQFIRLLCTNNLYITPCLNTLEKK